ncbi:hypothetical protein P885DRAFT_39936, partial [Corynascus similis CBS 632.67]
RAKQWTKYIWLRIELDPYDCGDCCQPESNYTHGKNTDVTERAMLEFFQIMSWWSYNYYGDGITLEISIHSPSDREHAFRSFDFDAVPNHESPEANLSHPAYDPGHDPSWARKAGAIRRLFGRGAMPVEFGCSLPTAEIISRLVVRRQTRRRMTPTGYAHIFSALKCLKSTAIEFWREWPALEQQNADNRQKFLLRRYLPHTLQSLTLFEDFDDRTTRTIESALRFPVVADVVELVRTPDPSLGRRVAELSRGYRHVAVAFLVDARDFFSYWAWCTLESLSLTSQLLDPYADPVEREKMLLNASVPMGQMPKLRTLEIWNGRPQIAALFRYQRSELGYHAAITWKATWAGENDLSHKVIKAFKTAAIQQGRWKPKGLGFGVLGWQGRLRPEELRFSVERQRLKSESISTHAHAIRQLGLQIQVLDPGSEEQIATEGMLDIPE